MLNGPQNATQNVYETLGYPLLNNLHVSIGLQYVWHACINILYLWPTTWKLLVAGMRVYETFVLTFKHFFRAKLVNLAEDFRGREKNLKEASVRNETELSSIKVQLNRKVSEVKKSEEELKKRQDEHDLIIRKVEDECSQLTKALESAKEKVQI